MRIALITNHPKVTGVGRYAFSLFEHLNYISNCDVDLFLMNRKNFSLYKYTASGKQVIKKLKHNILFNTYIAKNISVFNLFFDYYIAKYIPQEYDILHITNQISSNIVHYYNDTCKYIVTVHDIDYLTNPASYIQKIFSKCVYSGLYFSKNLISISYSTKNLLINNMQIPKDNIHVIYHGVDKIFRPIDTYNIEDIYKKYNLDRNFRYILNVGVDIPRKNFKTFLMAVYKLIKKSDLARHKVRIIKVGKISPRNIKLIRSLGLEKYILSFDYVSETDLVKLYNLADFFVFPSLHEGFGFPVLEAMACGTPVIVSNIPSILEVAGSAGLLVNPHSYYDLSEAMYLMLNDSHLRSELRIKGLKRSKSFSWYKCAKNVLRVYKKCV